jgi:hypothetical protein
MAEEFAQPLTWDSFVASLVDAYAPRSDGDRVLRRVTTPNCEITCREREIRTGQSYVDLELRVEHHGQMYLTAVHKERVAFSRRVDELRRKYGCRFQEPLSVGLAATQHHLREPEVVVGRGEQPAAAG